MFIKQTATTFTFLQNNHLCAYLCCSLLVVHGGGSQDDLKKPQGWQQNLPVAVHGTGDEAGWVPHHSVNKQGNRRTLK